MRVIVTCKILQNNEMKRAYLADGSGEPIIFDNQREAHAWAHMNKALFEAEPGTIIVRGRFGSQPHEEGDLVDGRVPCYLLDDAYIQDEDRPDQLVSDEGGPPISLRPDMEAYAQRLAQSPDQRA